MTIYIVYIYIDNMTTYIYIYRNIYISIKSKYGPAGLAQRLSVNSGTKRSLVRFPIRAHAWVGKEGGKEGKCVFL